MTYLSDALVSLRPNAQWCMNGDEYSGITWLDKNQDLPTEEELKAEMLVLAHKKALESCKNKAKELIGKTDWAVLPDVGLKNQSEFIAYRNALRNLIINPEEDAIFPDEPQPIWN